MANHPITLCFGGCVPCVVFMRSRRAGEVEQDISGGARVSDGQKVGLISLFYFIAQTHRPITFGFVTLPEKRSIGTLEEEKVIDRVY